jgi:catalase
LCGEVLDRLLLQAFRVARLLLKRPLEQEARGRMNTRNVTTGALGAVVGVVAMLGGSALAQHVRPRPEHGTMTNDNGAPVGDIISSQTAGPEGPVLLQDWNLIQRLARFDRERSPERVVHARGTGAFGEFVSAGDFSRYTRAQFLSANNLHTPVAVRFSSVIHPTGSPETLRDPRGFAVKFYTREGNYDLVGNDLPVFFIRDAIRFPDMVHSLKPSPFTNRQDPNRFFAFMAQTPESTNMLTHLYSDLGTPASYREMNGSGVHAFVWVNARGERTYVRYTWRTLQGERNLTAQQAAEMQGRDFQHMTTDLYASIRGGRFPSWDLFVQRLRPDQMAALDFDPLDATKPWPESLAALERVGRMTLNRMPANYYSEVEQLAFSPGSMVPGVEPSEDRLLQGRLFSYADTQRHRLGGNYLEIPVNRPLAEAVNFNQDGPAAATGPSNINFFPNSGAAQVNPDAQYRLSTRPVEGTTQQAPIRRTQNFRFAGERYRAFTPDERTHLISNLLGDLGAVQSEAVKLRMAAHFFRADEEYGRRVAEGLHLPIERVRAEAATLRD